MIRGELCLYGLATFQPLLAACLIAEALAPVNAQSNFPFVADEFEIPEKLETDEYRLRMLTINDLLKDYDAVMSSVGHLQKVWGNGWPEGLTLEENLVDLGWHQREFLNRSSFAYIMVTLDESKVIGCVYMNPTRKAGYDAEVTMWVRAIELESGLDSRLFATVKKWLTDDWPLENPGFPGRDIDWTTWNSVPD